MSGFYSARFFSLSILPPFTLKTHTIQPHRHMYFCWHLSLITHLLKRACDFTIYTFRLLYQCFVVRYIIFTFYFFLFLAMQVQLSSASPPASFVTSTNQSEPKCEPVHDVIARQPIRTFHTEAVGDSGEVSLYGPQRSLNRATLFVINGWAGTRPMKFISIEV